MKIKLPLLLAAFAFLIANCKKDNTPPYVPPVDPPDPVYLPLSIGSYWYYDIYLVNDSTGVEEKVNLGDTVRIIEEKIINGYNYFGFEQKEYMLSPPNMKDTVYLRDSSGYIVNLEGTIIFAHNDFNNTLRVETYGATFYQAEYSISDTLENITTAAGTFDCLNFKGRFNSTNPNDNFPDRFLNNYYAKDVGLVLETTFFVNSFSRHYERRLTEYHIE